MGRVVVGVLAFPSVKLLRSRTGTPLAEMLPVPPPERGPLDPAGEIAAVGGSPEATAADGVANGVGATVGADAALVAGAADADADALAAGVAGEVVVGVAVGVAVGKSAVQAGAVIVLESSVVAPFRASSRPVTFAPVVAVIEVRASTEPVSSEFVPSVAELPTCQYTLHGLAPRMSATTLVDAVVNVLPAWKTKIALASFAASSVSVPVRPSVGPV
jgi:hypothetical protein